MQSENGLTFGTDAFLLAAFAEGGGKKICADLGSGTGVIPLLCVQKNKFSRVFAVEIQEKFVSLIERNAKQNAFTERVIPICADVRSLRSSDIGFEVDAVTANPPYMKLDSGKRNEYDEKFIARHEVCGDINDFCACAYRLLRHGGKFYSVWRPDRLSALMASMTRHRLEPKRMVFVHADEQSEPSMVLTEARLDGAPSLKILPPLFLHSSESRGDRSRPLTPRAQSIYDSMRFCE